MIGLRLQFVRLKCPEMASKAKRPISLESRVLCFALLGGTAAGVSARLPASVS